MSRIKPILLALSLALPFATTQGAEPAASPGAGEKAAAPSPARTGAHLGVAVDRLPPPLAAQLPAEVPRGQGLLVLNVRPDSPAAKAGLQPYDVLLSYDDQRLFAPEQLARLVAADKPGRKVHLQVARSGQLKEFEVALGEGAPTGMVPPPMRHAPWGATMMPPMPRQQRPLTGPAPEQPAPRVREMFQSLAVERLPDGRYHATMKYKDSSGELRSFSFEGSREEIRRKILQTPDLPPPARRQLLNAIGMAERPPFSSFGGPLNFRELMEQWRERNWGAW